MEASRLIESGSPADAAVWLELPEAVPATRDRAMLLRARAAIQLGRPADAVSPLNKVDPAGPSAADAAFWKGRTLHAVGQYAQAVRWFRAALEGRHDDAEFHRRLAAAAYDLGDRATAIQALQDATRLDPGDARSWRTLGLIFKENVDHGLARDAYLRSLELDPIQPAVRLELAEVSLASGLHAEAERQLAACQYHVPEDDRAALLARCLVARGEPSRARAIIDGTLKTSPGHAGLLAESASLYLSERLPAEAVADLDRALEVDPFRPAWLYKRGMALRLLGREEAARRDLERAAELERLAARMSELDDEAGKRPDDPNVRSDLGDLCIRLGKASLAAAWYRAALSCDPKHVGARQGLASLRGSAARRD